MTGNSRLWPLNWPVLPQQSTWNVSDATNRVTSQPPITTVIEYLSRNKYQFLNILQAEIDIHCAIITVNKNVVIRVTQMCYTDTSHIV